VNAVAEINIMAKAINLIFPHQLFSESPLLTNGNPTYLIEEHLFFTQYRFHKQKIAFHRASMQCYKDFLEKKKIPVYYIEAHQPLADIQRFSQEIRQKAVVELHFIDPVDDWLSSHLNQLDAHLKLVCHETPQFLNSSEEINDYFRKDKKRFSQADFYKRQRRKHNILLDANNEPLGGQWTYDADNRKKYPRKKTPPALHFPETSKYWQEAISYVNKNFNENPGSLTSERIYPVTHAEAEKWLEQFLNYRFADFGSYEDAIVSGESFLHHSLLSPLLNAGLLTPQQVISRTLEYLESHDIPLNSSEGFIRQIIGWREFVRGMYIAKGRYSRSQNFWGFKRKIPASFYDGTTGIHPVDETIKRLLATGYSHHIERLMILGNFMLLCEFDPNEVYRWFMELYIDAYDWVMVPNVYGMSQFADGGSFATKPYIAGSNYLKKMSNYPSGDWQATWDGLFWRFIIKHGEFFKANPRLSMMYHSSQRMAQEKIKLHLNNANNFLDGLYYFT
jgi:deoxyribodipyrimidine photolyase-related protein